MKANNARYWLGRRRSAESIAKTASGKRGKKLNDEQRKRLSDAHKGLPSGNRVSIIQFEFATKTKVAEFDSIQRAANTIGCLKTSIVNNLSGLSMKIRQGYYFKYKGGLN